MLELHVRLEPQAEPRCGLDPATVTYLQRALEGESALDRITAGLIFPKALDMALRAPIDPLTLALTIRNELSTAPFGIVLRYQLELEKANARIIERDRLRYLEERARHTPKDGRARTGTRSTRSHRKKKVGR